MGKRVAILAAVKAAIESVKTSNSYDVSVGEVVIGPRVIPESVEAWPHVELQHGEEVKQNHAIGRAACVVSFFVGVYCQTDSLGESDFQCSETCAAIETAIVRFDRVMGRFLDLTYVTNVFVSVINPMELPPEIERGISLWVMTVEVTYHHEKENP